LKKKNEGKKAQAHEERKNEASSDDEASGKSSDSEGEEFVGELP